MCNLPGSVKKLAAASTVVCDYHDDKLAVVRVQGETDSFGAEYEFLCQACYTQYKLDMEEAGPMEGACDYCKNHAILTHWRDPGEGSCGPVFTICEPCARKAYMFDCDE